MYITYFDESGDDGYPKYSSKIFVLTSLYLHYRDWQDIYNRIHQFRQFLKSNYNFPIKLEFHTKQLLLNKKPFRYFGFSDAERLDICKEFASFVSTLDFKVINVVINKLNINSINEKRYKNVLDAVLSFNIQRLENSIKKIEQGTKFISITDEGRVGKMRKTSRRIQKINFIPSKFSSVSYRSEIKLLIEDPLPKNSKESYFIQICDFIAYMVYLYILRNNSIDKWHNRLLWLDPKEIDNIIDILKNVFNTEAHSQNEYGFVIYPK